MTTEEILRKMRSAEVQPVTKTAPAVACPSCGRCPTCGHVPYRLVPMPYLPYTPWPVYPGPAYPLSPWWGTQPPAIWIGTPGTTTTGATSTSLSVAVSTLTA